MQSEVASSSKISSTLSIETGIYRKHFQTSHTFLLSNKFNVEIVYRPYNEPNVNLDNALWTILMRSCEKSPSEEAHYREKINIRKVAINVDYLILVSLSNNLIAFTSGSHVTDNIFYINAAMVLPEYHSTGIGGIITCMLALGPVMRNLQKKIKTHLICRTQNRKAASLFIHACEKAQISTEALNSTERRVVEETVSFLHCLHEPQTGITPNVYPEGLPKGHEINDERINKAFAPLGPTDACYVLGLLKINLVGHLLKGKLSPNNQHILCST